MLTPEQEAEWFGAENQDMMCCGDYMEFHDDYFYCPVCECSVETKEFEAEIPQSVKYGFGFGAGMALFQVAIIGTAMILGARRQ